MGGHFRCGVGEPDKHLGGKQEGSPTLLNRLVPVLPGFTVE